QTNKITSGSPVTCLAPSTKWHLNEIYTKINEKMVYLWRAVDDEGTVLDVVVQSRRNTKAAMRLLRKLLRNQGIKPTRIVTDKLGSYGAALKLIGLENLQDIGGRKNNRAECSHVPIRRRERKAQKFRSVHKAQKLLSAHAQFYNPFNLRRHLISRNTLWKFRHDAKTEWNLVTAAACA
ncbi:MAG: DDE-type integrase/transposase/recombinase, partial [Litorimonas sp.]